MSPDVLDCISLQRSERAKKREIAENIYDPFFVSIIFGHCLFWWFGAFFVASRVTLHTLSQFEIPINEYNLHTRNFHAFVLSKRHLLFIARFEYDTFPFVRGFLHRLLLFFFLLLLCRFFLFFSSAWTVCKTAPKSVAEPKCLLRNSFTHSRQLCGQRHRQCITSKFGRTFNICRSFGEFDVMKRWIDVFCVAVAVFFQVNCFFYFRVCVCVSNKWQSQFSLWDPVCVSKIQFFFLVSFQFYLVSLSLFCAVKIPFLWSFNFYCHNSICAILIPWNS